MSTCDIFLAVLSYKCKQFKKWIFSFLFLSISWTGIGPDGHIAFNEPGSSLASRTRVKTLAVDTIEANARFFDNDLSKVPNEALTVGVGTVMDAREVKVPFSIEVQDTNVYSYKLCKLQKFIFLVLVCFLADW